MPLVSLNKINEDSYWALWKIDEEIGHFFRELKFSQEDKEFYDSISNHYKKLEFLGSRTVVKKLVEHMGFEYRGIFKDDHGKPHLNDLSIPISLSHSYPYTAAMINKNIDVGIDIERLKEKIVKIGPKFLNKDEYQLAHGDVHKTTIIWAAKECLYKMYGRRFLIFKENLAIDPFEMKEYGELKGRIKLPDNHSEHILRYENHEDYVITYTIS